MQSEAAMCPTDDVLGAHVRGTLPDVEAEHVMAHLDDCASCRDAVIAAVRAEAVTGLAIGTPSLPHVALRAPNLAIGSRVGRYELRALLGAGGMGHVYEAYDTELDRAIALKVLRPELAGARTVAERLARESRLMAKVAHPAVITVYDVGRAGDTVFIAMELVRGETLAAHIARCKPSWREVVRLFERAGGGLAAAHAAGIVHRDFKPDNVLVELDSGRDRALRVIVTDFGIARGDADDELVPNDAPANDVRLTATGLAVGTPAYMAPEQLDGKRVDVRADVFAFCASLWEGLFGERPFRGETVAEIRAAFTRAPKATRHVPFALVAALERGLAVEPSQRFAELPPLLAKLRTITAVRGRLTVAAGALSLVAVAGIAGALVMARGFDNDASDDTCSRGHAAFDRAYGPERRFALQAALGADPHARDRTLAGLDAVASAWHAAQVATCHRGATPVQAPAIATCLEARRLEVTGFVDDLLLDGPRYALALGGAVQGSANCFHPSAGMLTAKIPEDPALRRQVTALRYHVFDAEAARDRADYATAIAIGTQYADAGKVWSPVQAEILYMLGTAENLGGDNKQSLVTLRKAATLAEANHYDYLATNAWIQMSLATTQDEGDNQRGLEYIAFAEAALDRLGRPPEQELMVDYAKGVALSNSGRSDEAEATMRRALEIAESGYPQYLSQVIQGIGYIDEDRGHFASAVQLYQQALAHLPAAGTGVVESEIIMRERLAINLANTGRIDEAVASAERALVLAKQTHGANNMDIPIARTQLAEVLQGAAQIDRAFAETQTALHELAAIEGERNERYGEVLSFLASLYIDKNDVAQADKLYARACDIIAFTTQDTSPQYAQCVLDHTNALEALGRNRDGLAMLEKVMPVFTTAGDHAAEAQAFAQRGALYEDLGDHARARADLEHARSLVTDSSLEPGRVASIDYTLARVLWSTDRARARELLDGAIEKFDHAIPNWHALRDEAIAWRNGVLKHRARVRHAAPDR